MCGLGILDAYLPMDHNQRHTSRQPGPMPEIGSVCRPNRAQKPNLPYLFEEGHEWSQDSETWRQWLGVGAYLPQLLGIPHQ